MGCVQSNLLEKKKEKRNTFLDLKTAPHPHLVADWLNYKWIEANCAQRETYI